MAVTASPQSTSLSIIRSVSRTLITIAIPIILTVLAVRGVMSTWFLQLEYNRPGFPADTYGFTMQQRLTYAQPAIDYLLTPTADIAMLGELRLPSEQVPPDVCIPASEDDTLCNMYNPRELRHMEDVHLITQYTYRIGIISALLGAIATIYLWRTYKPDLRAGLFGGSVLTLGIIGTIIVLALTSWDTFFTGFHSVFFEGDSWLFRYSDTLIRLFPEQFWFDAALLIGTLVTLGALIVLAITYWGKNWFYAD